MKVLKKEASLLSRACLPKLFARSDYNKVLGISFRDVEGGVLIFFRIPRRRDSQLYWDLTRILNRWGLAQDVKCSPNHDL